MDSYVDWRPLAAHVDDGCRLHPRTPPEAKSCFESDARRTPQPLGVILTQADVS